MLLWDTYTPYQTNGTFCGITIIHIDLNLYNNMDIITLKNLYVDELASAFKHSLSCSKKVGFMIHDDKLSYVAEVDGAFFKRYAVSLDILCEEHVIPDATKPVHAFIMNGKNFLDTLKNFDGVCSIDLYYTKSVRSIDNGKMVCDTIRIYNDDARCDYVCAELMQGYVDKSSAELERIFSNFENFSTFPISDDQLKKITKFSKLNNTDEKEQKVFTIFSEDGQLKAGGVGFELVLDKEYKGDPISDCTIPKSFIDLMNDGLDYTVDINEFPDEKGTYKAVFRGISEHRLIESAFHLLKSVDDVEDDDIDDAFSQFELSILGAGA